MNTKPKGPLRREGTRVRDALLSGGIGARMLEVITSAKLSQNEFAERVGSSSSFISNVVRGEQVPGSEFLVLVKREFDVSIDWLLTGEGTMNATASAIDIDRFRLTASLVELARRAEAGDRTAAEMVSALVSGESRVSELDPVRNALLFSCEEACTEVVFAAVVYSGVAGIYSETKSVETILRTAQARATLRRPMRTTALGGIQESVPVGRMFQMNTGRNVRAAMRDFNESGRRSQDSDGGEHD